jgi:hypothetical protein
VPKDVEPAKPPAQVSEKGTVIAGAKERAKPSANPAETGGISVTVDQLARPGAVVSGEVTFSDGNTAAWYLDETNRLGLVPKQKGYRPSAKEVQQFQMALQEELSKY